MAATIKIKNSSTAGAAPTASDLVQGELAVNVTDKRLYTENSGGTIVELGTNPSVPVTFPDGSASAPSLTNDGDTNTGLFFPAADTVGIATGGTERARVDSSGNLGLGVTPSAWSLKALQVNGASIFGYTALNANIGANFYYDGSANKYIANGAAELLQLDAGAFKFFNATSGTAGNAITFTQAMTLDASGNLLVGNTTPFLNASGRGLINVNGSSSSAIAFGVGGTRTGHIYSDTFELAIANNNGANGYIALQTNGAERARIDSSGNLLVGVTSTVNSSKMFMGFSGGRGFGINDAAGGSGTQIVWFQSAGTQVGSITTTTTATSYNTSSDYRLKNVTGSLTGYKERLSALQPKQGSWKADGSEFRGFLAHEFAVSYPTSVNGEKDAVDADGNPQYQGMQAGSSEVIADLVAYIKELETRLTALEQA